MYFRKNTLLLRRAAPTLYGEGTSACMADANDAPMAVHAAAGVLGRASAETFKSPFDLLKVRRQYDLHLKQRPLPLALFSLVREDGMRAWRGLPPRLIWSAPLAAATFTYYQVLKTESNGRGSSGDGGGLSLKTVVGGPMVLALSVGLRTPFDVIEQKLQLAGVKATADQKAAFIPTPDAMWQRLSATWRAEGMRGLWRGYPAALAGIFSYVAGYFYVYEGTRRTLESRPFFAEHPTITHLAGGALGGGITAAVATPFDTVKVRMQTRVYVTPDDPFPSMLRVWRATVRDAGWRGLWRGATARAVSNAPSGAIMFAVYEASYRWLGRRLRTAGGEVGGETRV